jgi:hypothetical protein
MFWYVATYFNLIVNKMFNGIFYRAYKYYGENDGLISATILLSGIILICLTGFYNIWYKCFNQYGDALGFLDDKTSKIKFRLIYGPFAVLALQQIIYWIYRYKNYYLKIVAYYDERKNPHFIFRNAHFISFIAALILLVGSFFIGDFINKLIYQ